MSLLSMLHPSMLFLVGLGTTVVVANEPEPIPPTATETTQPIVVVASPAATNDTPILVDQAERLTRLETEFSTFRSEVAQIAGGMTRIEQALAEPEQEESVVEVVPEPIREVDPPKKTRHPLLTLLLGKSSSQK